PKEGDGKKPKPDKGSDKPGTRKPKPDKDGPGRRPNKKGPNKRKPHPDKSGPGRPKSKPEKDRHKKEEGSKESKEDRLRRIVARLRPGINHMTEKGIKPPFFNAALFGLKSWYRLTALEAKNANPVSVT
ncbi:hypothetical protein ACWGK9_36135, partial [Streptomyces rubiginosohelvolus]